MLTAKDALVAPAATVTLPAIVATAGLLLDSVTGAPPAGAGPFSVTVPVGEDVPPVTLAGLTLSEVAIGGATVSVAIWLAPA